MKIVAGHLGFWRGDRRRRFLGAGRPVIRSVSDERVEHAALTLSFDGGHTLEVWLTLPELDRARRLLAPRVWAIPDEEGAGWAGPVLP